MALSCYFEDAPVIPLNNLLYSSGGHTRACQLSTLINKDLLEHTAVTHLLCIACGGFHTIAKLNSCDTDHVVYKAYIVS